MADQTTASGSGDGGLHQGVFRLGHTLCELGLILFPLMAGLISYQIQELSERENLTAIRRTRLNSERPLFDGRAPGSHLGREH